MSETKRKIAAMVEGGKLIHEIKMELKSFSSLGEKFINIEQKAQQLIKKVDAKPNFSLEPGYKWAICINKNEGMVHGIPDQKTIEDGDLISIDMGLLWQGYNLDTSISFIVGNSTSEKDNFLHAGEKALTKAIDQAWPGNSVYDISKAIEKTIKSHGYNPSFQLTGHGIGKKLHEEPLIPCVASRQDKKKKLTVGQTIAIEVMYAAGNPYVVLDDDGWTYRTIDYSLSSLTEETVLITENGPQILT